MCWIATERLLLKPPFSVAAQYAFLMYHNPKSSSAGRRIVKAALDRRRIIKYSVSAVTHANPTSRIKGRSAVQITSRAKVLCCALSLEDAFLSNQVETA